ncbi:hypothetical protein NQ317_012683 [Molorchus minor]|uniref:THAP-type domain-containing protein n=1 Tax=Molorchus minor TaxID=1323400 RepID=A0ABQ9IUX9_9CUCU|nr:hypothetical protein NQ317_012683 [Molorchus minor]
MVMCWVLGCKHYNVRERCKFYKFPKDVKERDKWIRLLRRNKKPGPGASVCSCHFRDGVKSNGPEIFAHDVSRRGQLLFTPTEKQKTKSNPMQSNSPSLAGSTELSEVKYVLNHNMLACL